MLVPRPEGRERNVLLPRGPARRRVLRTRLRAPLGRDPSAVTPNRVPRQPCALLAVRPSAMRPSAVPRPSYVAPRPCVGQAPVCPCILWTWRPWAVLLLGKPGAACSPSCHRRLPSRHAHVRGPMWPRLPWRRQGRWLGSEGKRGLPDPWHLGMYRIEWWPQKIGQVLAPRAWKAALLRGKAFADMIDRRVLGWDRPGSRMGSESSDRWVSSEKGRDSETQRADSRVAMKAPEPRNSGDGGRPPEAARGAGGGISLRAPEGGRPHRRLDLRLPGDKHLLSQARVRVVDHSSSGTLTWGEGRLRRPPAQGLGGRGRRPAGGPLGLAVALHRHP